MGDISIHWNSEIIERNDRILEGIAFVKLLRAGKFLQKESWFFLCLKPFCKNLLNVVLSLVLWTWQLVIKETQDSICITKDFFTGFMDEFKSKLHLFKLPSRISSPCSCIPVTACLIIILWSFFVCFGSEVPESYYARNLREFGVAVTGGESVNSTGYREVE